MRALGWLRRRVTLDRDEGFVLVWMASMLVLLLGAAALSVDIGRWYVTHNEEQKAADAAALAGAVFLPEDLNQARTTALAVAARNGFENDGDTTVTAELADRPNQLRVTITREVENYFAAVMGFDTQTLSRSAVGEYQRPVAMGSPVNQFGNDPECGGAHGSTCYPDFWANIAGRQTTKVSGDRYTAETCGGAENCPGEYDADGHIFTIRVNSPGLLRVEVFDPGYVWVGDHCTAQNAALNQIATLAPAYGLPSATYTPGDTNLSCTGDEEVSSSGSGDEPATTFTMRSPGPLPPDPASSPVINTSSCSAETFPGVRDNLPTSFTTNLPQSSSGIGFRDSFRQWTQVCEVSAVPGDYFLQVQAPAGRGHNRFAVRATVGGSSSDVAVHGFDHMAIYANAPAANTTFYMARVPSSAAGYTLIVDLFDIGDAASTGTLTMLPPSDSNVGGSFSDCTFQKGVSGVPQPSPSCSVGGVSSSAGYQGTINQFRIPLPEDYTCADASPTGCWVRIRLAFGGGVQDTTTWSAHLEGDPVRLIQ